MDSHGLSLFNWWLPFEPTVMPGIITLCFSGYYSSVKGQGHYLQHKLNLALYRPAHSRLVAQSL